MAAERARITVIGGGPFAVRLCEALADTAGIPAVEVVLVARDCARLSLIANHAELRVRRVRPDWTVRAEVERCSAIEGARVVVLLVRVGGLQARAYQETFPDRFGLVGDEGIGPGGMANAWHSLPVCKAIFADIWHVAPTARVLNMMAPLGMTTRLALDSGLDAVGLCELPLTTRRQLVPAFGQDSKALDYAGLNHLGWFWPRDEEGRNALEVAAASGIVDSHVLERFGAAPLSYYYDLFDHEARDRLGRHVRSGRARWLSALGDRLFQGLVNSPGADLPEMEQRPTPWFDQALAPIVAALLGDAPHRGFVNVANEGRLAGIQSDVVVELPAHFRGRSIDIEAPRCVPLPVLRFLRRIAKAEDLAYLAARDRVPTLLREALLALPVKIRKGDVSALVGAILKPFSGSLEASL